MKNQPLWIRREPDPEPEPVTEPITEEQPWPCSHGPYLSACPLPRQQGEKRRDWYRRGKAAGYDLWQYDPCFGNMCNDDNSWFYKSNSYYRDKLRDHANGTKPLGGFEYIGAWFGSFVLDQTYMGSNHNGSPW